MKQYIAPTLAAAATAAFMWNQSNISNDRVNDVIKSWDALNQEISATNISTNLEAGIFNTRVSQEYSFDGRACVREHEQSHLMGVNLKGSGRVTCAPSLPLDKLDL